MTVIWQTEENERSDALTNLYRDPVPFKVTKQSDLASLRKSWSKLVGIPTILKGREDGLDHSFPGFDVRTLLTGDNSAGRVTYHDIKIDPGASLPLHYQRQAHTYLYVLEGDVELTIGSATEKGSASTFGYAPPKTTQGVRNVGSEPARVYVSYLPAGADRAFAEAHELWLAEGATVAEPYLAVLEKYGFCFDIDDPLENDANVNGPTIRYECEVKTIEDYQQLREDWKSRPGVPKLSLERPSDPSFVVPDPETGALVFPHILATGDDTQGSAVFSDAAMEPNYGAGPHHQPTEEEAFFVLEGELDLLIGNQTVRVGPGAFGFAPRNTTHGFRNPQADGKQTRVLAMNSPGGHERGFEQILSHSSAIADGTGTFDDLLESMVAHGWLVHV